MTSRVMNLDDAVARLIHDGDTVFVGGFGQCIPFATAHAMIRRGCRDLTLCRSGADILFDLLIAAGAVRKVLIGYLGNPGIGLAHAFRRAAESGQIEIEDWTNFSMVLRLHAGALGIPFLPTATLKGGDLPAAIGAKPITCPFTGEELVAVPALNPNVAILHAQRADAEGNVQIDGLVGDTLDGALASERILVTVEEIVSREAIRRSPERTVLPAFRVSAICHVPWGAYPSYVQGWYGRDDDAYGAWDKISRDKAGLENWIGAEIRALPGFADHMARIDPARLRTLSAAQGRADLRIRP